MIAQETIRETTVTARGIELFVRERGDGFPLLLINGLGGTVEMWGPDRGAPGGRRADDRL